jgi:hypothetical protein
MKYQIQLIILLFFYSNIFGQKIHVISQGAESDSSFYHIEKINENEFWAAGEYGILKKIDSLGNVSSISFPNEGQNILKIIKKENFVFIITDNAIIYRYDILNKIFIKKTFPDFKNKCFYDIIALQNGKLIVCGGTSAISKGEKKIPKGFIAILDQDLKEINIVWRNYRKFVWSLLELENGEVLASTYNGVNSKIIKTKDFKCWKKVTKIKGLVHEIAHLDNHIWYSGAKSFHFKNDGVFGMVDQTQLQSNNTGCLWSMDMINGKIISVTANGKLLVFDKNKSEIEQIKNLSPYAFYDIEKISESKIMIVGHGKSIFIIDL